MTGFTQDQVHVFQNNFDEIIEDLHAQAFKNRKQISYKNVCHNYLDEIIEDLHAIADRNRKQNSFSLENILVKM